MRLENLIESGFLVRVARVNMPNIIDKFYRDYCPDGVQEDCTAEEMVKSLCIMIDEIFLKDENEYEKFYKWVEKIIQLQCEVIADHKWIYDHCGFWGHQYCEKCHEVKYPDLGKLSCSEAFKLLNGMTEEEYKLSHSK